MNSDKRIINVVGSMGGLKTRNHHYLGRFSKKVKEEKEDFQTEQTIIVYKSSATTPCSASGIYHYNPKNLQYQLL